MSTKTLAFIGIVIVLLVLAWMGGQNLAGSVVRGRIISPGDIVFNQISTSGSDWVTLHNNTDKTVSIGGFIFTDGDNRYILPADAVIEAGKEVRLASTKDKGKIQGTVDYYWGNWGLSSDGELTMLINKEGDMVVDFVFTPKLKDGEILQRFPAGTGVMSTPSNEEVIQLKSPSYRAVPLQALQNVEKNFSTYSVSFGGFLGTIATLLMNFDTIKTSLTNLTSKPPKGQKS